MFISSDQLESPSRVKPRNTLRNFSHSKLNVLMFTLRTGLAHYKDSW